jgi:hypothetical protein
MSIVNDIDPQDEYGKVIEELVQDKIYDRLCSIEWDHFSSIVLDKKPKFYIIDILYFSQHGVGGDYFTEEYKLCGAHIKINSSDQYKEIEKGITRLGKKLIRLKALT